MRDEKVKLVTTRHNMRQMDEQVGGYLSRDAFGVSDLSSLQELEGWAMDL